MSQIPVKIVRSASNNESIKQILYNNTQSPWNIAGFFYDNAVKCTYTIKLACFEQSINYRPVNTAGCARTKKYNFWGSFYFNEEIIVNERHILIEGEVNPHETPITKFAFLCFMTSFLKSHIQRG